MNIAPTTKLCMIVGSPVKHSLSPAMHNAALVDLLLDDEYVYVGCEITENRIPHFVDAIKTLKIHGISCTAPLKESIMPYLDRIDSVASEIGAVNTILYQEDKLSGFNTDWQGIVKPLSHYLKAKAVPMKALIVGAGGAAKAAAYGLSRLGLDTTICNRDRSAAISLAGKYDFAVADQDRRLEVSQFDVIINSVPSNAQRENDFFDYLGSNVHGGQIMFDITYGSVSLLAEQARRNDLEIIDGRQMLLYQGMEQFRIFTNAEPSELVMRKALGLEVRS
jgi:shikimate dehydrogenase